MQNYTETLTEPKIISKVVKSENGLQNLVAYYQELFEIEEIIIITAEMITRTPN